jgi:glyoxylate utilization-related uncharacterized protein
MTEPLLVANDGTVVEPAHGHTERLLELGYTVAPPGTVAARTNETATPKRVRWQWEDDR